MMDQTDLLWFGKSPPSGQPSVTALKRSVLSRRALVVSSLFLLFCVACPLTATPTYVSFTSGEDYHVGALVVADHEVAESDLVGGWSLTLTGMTSRLPRGSAIDALDFKIPDRVWFSLDTDAVLDDVLYADEDVIFWNGSTFSLGWDGSASGVPVAADLDALHVARESAPLELYFSLDVDASLGSLGLVADEDVVLFREGEGMAAIAFDGSVEGVAPGANLDAFSVENETAWLMSLDAAGAIDGLTFDDADLVSWNPQSHTFQRTPIFDAASLGLPSAIDLASARAMSAAAGQPSVLIVY